MILFCAILALFVNGMTASMLGTILPDLSDRLRLTPSQNGTIAFAQAVGMMIASLAAGPLLDTEGDKIGLMLGLACIALALILLPRANEFWNVAILLFVLGAGSGIVVTGANALVSGVSVVHRATALNLVNLFFGLGGLATPFISANLFKRNWGRLCYSVAGLSMIALAIQTITQMPAPVGQGGFVLSQAVPILGRPLLPMLGLLLFLYVSCEVGVWNWLPRHLIAQGIPEARALNILSLGFALGLIIGRIGVSSILIRVRPIEVTLAASVAIAVTTFFMLRTNKPAAAAALVFAAGVSMAPVFPTALAITGTAFPQMSGTAIGFVITCGWAGLAVSSRLIGLIAGGDPLRLKKALLLIPAFAVVMVSLNLSIWSAMR